MRVASWWRKPWVRVTAAVLSVPLLVLFISAGYYYVSFSRLIDQSLHGERDRVFPQVFARPLEIYRLGRRITAGPSVGLSTWQ